MSEESTNALYSTTQPIVTPPISMDDILNSVQVLRKKEADDKIILESIGNMTPDTLKEKLVNWAIAGFPNLYEIYKVDITPPNVCSDGVTRGLTDYISYCSGKTIYEHVSILQAKVTGMNVSFANTGSYIAITIIKA